MKLHDQDIMDLLAAYGDGAVEDFGNCLSDVKPDAPKSMLVEIVNRVLEQYPLWFKVVNFAGMDDDGYFWEVKEV